MLVRNVKVAKEYYVKCKIDLLMKVLLHGLIVIYVEQVVSFKVKGKQNFQY